jgi:hypothetical protein
MRPPFLVQVLAALLTFYAMAGVWLAMTMASDRDPRFHWLPLAIAGTAFAISAGVGALAVWRQERRGPMTLIVCAVIGATLCGAMPFAVRDSVVSRDTRLVSVAGGLLFAAFLVLAARFIRLSLRSRKS